MPDEPPTPGPRGPMPGWGPPGPPTGAWGGPPPSGPADPRKRFGIGSLLAAGAGGAVIAVIGMVLLAILLATVVDQPARHPSVGTYAPLAESADVISKGDCLSDRPEFAVVANTDDVVPCRLRHRSEVVGVATLPSLSARPSARPVSLFTSEACSLAFHDYTGADPERTPYDFGAVVPDAKAWAAGDRTVFCLVDSRSHGNGVGSIRTAG